MKINQQRNRNGNSSPIANLRTAALAFGMFMSACESTTTTSDLGSNVPKPLDSAMAPLNDLAAKQFVVEKGTIAPLGDKKAPVKIIRYSDYTGRPDFLFSDQAWLPLRESYVDGAGEGKAVVYFRDFPNDTIQFAKLAARSARCAGVVSMYWEMHDVQFTKQAEWISSRNPRILFRAYAKELGVDMIEYNDCMDRESNSADIVDDIRSMLGTITETPAHFILIPKERIAKSSIYEGYAVIGHPQSVQIMENTGEYVIWLTGASPLEYFKAFLDRVDFNKDTNSSK